MGVGLALITVALIAQWVGENQLGARSRRRRMEREIDRLHDHTIICAYGRVGRAVARELRNHGRPFVVIDPQEDLRERMDEDGVLYVIDDPSSEAVLKRAGVERARSLVSAVDSDATNVYITLIARSIRADLQIVARASEPGSPERLTRAGADRVVSPFVSSGHTWPDGDAARAARRAGRGRGGPRRSPSRNASVPRGSPLVGRPVGHAGAPVLALRRLSGEVVANPPGDLELAEGDTMLVLAPEASLRGGEPARRA